MTTIALLDKNHPTALPRMQPDTMDGFNPELLTPLIRETGDPSPFIETIREDSRPEFRIRWPSAAVIEGALVQVDVHSSLPSQELMVIQAIRRGLGSYGLGLGLESVCIRFWLLPATSTSTGMGRIGGTSRRRGGAAAQARILVT